MKSQTDWERVRRDIAQDAPIVYEPEDGPYDPNDAAATEAFFDQATVISPKKRGPQKSPTKRLVSLRLSPEVVEHYKAQGPGWQTRIDEVLKTTIGPKRRKRAG